MSIGDKVRIDMIIKDFKTVNKRKKKSDKLGIRIKEKAKNQKIINYNQ